MAIWHDVGQLLTAAVPRLLATILNETIVARMHVLLHRCRMARLISCRALTHFAREGYFLAPVYDRFTEGFCDCGHADRASRARLAPAASSVTLTFAGDGHARGARPGITFRLQTSGGSPGFRPPWRRKRHIAPSHSRPLSPRSFRSNCHQVGRASGQR